MKTVWVGLLLLFSCSLFWGNELYAEKVYPDAWRQDVLGVNEVATSMNSDAENAEFALTLAPLAHHYRLKTIDMYSANSNYNQALVHSRVMLKFKPLSDEGLLVSGTILDASDNHDDADRLMQAALKTNPVNQSRHIERINRLLVQGKQREAMKYAYYALSLYPNKTGECLALLDLYDISEDDKRLAIPQRSAAYWAYAKIQSEQGNYELADIYYTNAVRLASGEVQPNPEIYLNTIDFLLKDDQLEAALNISLQGQEIFPHKAKLAYLSGQIYEQTGIKYRAIEEYRKALLLDPGNQLVQSSLSALKTR
jgi:tetratricopeptide (TPR) repeat protein